MKIISLEDWKNPDIKPVVRYQATLQRALNAFISLIDEVDNGVCQFSYEWTIKDGYIFRFNRRSHYLSKE